MDGIKSFALDETGDILIENKEIQMVNDKELIRQEVWEILSTNKGEWFFNWEQGIEFDNILGKGVTEEAVRNEIVDGLQQVDENLSISDFSMTVKGRKAYVKFNAVNEVTNEEIQVSTTF